MSINPFLIGAILIIGIVTAVNSINFSASDFFRPIWIVAAFMYVGLSMCGMFLLIEEAHKRSEQEKARLEMLKKEEEEKAAKGIKDEYHAIVQFTEDSEEFAYKCDLPNVQKGDIVRVMLNGKEKNAKIARIVLSYKPYIRNNIIRKATKEEQMLWLKKDC